MPFNQFEPTHVEEPHQPQGYADLLTSVATEHRAVIVRRGGNDVAAIIPLECLEILQEAIALEVAQRLLKTIDLRKLAKTSPPPQAWFDRDEPKPF